MASTTVQTVDGIPVIADEAVETPLSTPDRPVYFTRIRRLLLANESTVYGCTECEFTSDTMPMVRGHLTRLHKEPKSGGTPPAPVSSALSMTVGELLEQANQIASLLTSIERLAGDRDEWKGRARKAEGDLAAVRKALARLGIAGITA
jgi:hypothetical protein